MPLHLPAWHPRTFRLAIALIIPVIATLIQQWIWPHISPMMWLLLYPAVFFSAWVGGFWGGVLSTAMAVALGFHFFALPGEPGSAQVLMQGYSASIFVMVGLLVSLTHEKLKRSQRALQEANANNLKMNGRLNLALTSAQAGIWEWDMQTSQIFWSDTLWPMYGIDPSNPPSYDTWLESVHADDRASVIASLNHFCEAGLELNLEWRVADPPGHDERWLMSRGQPVFDEQGKTILYRGIVLDITQLKQQQQLVEEHRQRLDFALSTLEAGAWELNLKDHTTHRTLFHDQLFGYRELLPEWTLEKFIAHVLPEDRDAVTRRFNAAVQTRSDWDFECRIRRTDGEIRWIYAKGRLRQDPQGRPVSMAGIVQDITDAKQTQDLLKEIAVRKDEFLAMLAHELRNPLAPISNAVQIMKRSHADEVRLAWCQDVIGRQVEQLARLVDDLLDISRISRGKIELKQKILKVSTIVQRAVETNQPLMEARRHELTVQLPPEPIYVEGDLMRLAQVVSNLLNNAAKYTDAGGFIKLSVEQIGNHVFIRVRDNGRGIDPASLSSLFELFYQVDRTIDRAEGGLGIGLSLVKSLVAMHGGDVWAESEGRGQGSEFVVRLPCVPSMSDAPVVNQTDSKPSVEGPMRILVVDDNHDAAQSLSLLLTGEGHTVRLAYNGPMGLEAALTERPQIILLDIGLPGMDGYAVARAVRQHPELKKTQLIALSGYGREVDRERARAAGFNRYLTKPVSFDDLQGALYLLSFSDQASG
jgi:PAS domain S-box-containing protein